MSEILFVVANQPVSFGMALVAGGVVLLLALLVLVIVVARGGAARTRAAEDAAQRTEDLELRLAEMARMQAETVGRLQTMGEGLAARQSDLARLVNERLDAVSGRIGQSMEATTKQTVERLQHLHERLALIDNAQKNLNELSSQVTSLRDVLSNKQARGAFGQARMEAIVQDGLPKGSFQFQFTLSNNTRPDCVIFMPEQPPLVIDAKFPLEAVTAHRDAKTDEQRRLAAQRLRQDVLRHVADIAGKYLIPGETQDLALMFVPAESVYSELHDTFDDVVQKSYRSRVIIVSPSLLMLAIQVMQQIHKDARMRAAADRIRHEVAHMINDVGRMRERVLKLQQHFTQSGEDLRHILISAEKVERRASAIEELDFGEGERTATVIPAPVGKLGAAE
ncbi:MAG: DNA recombination protein RmuC [Xanthobacteraceae bacterium]|nr:DNA recombination protein RmuC [Xanthobacteraceae bacterium]MBV9234501.1 DNA recombination protein RmuC [Xanthobacteraceae bacterium]MBV9630197.1 DNA recombination protein RmuC [Xanthobacteraceae bacterium]